MSSWTAALAMLMLMLMSSLPKILVFLLILTIGWFIASLLAKAIAVVFRSIKFNVLAERSGFAGFVNKMDLNVDSTGLIGGATKWLVRLVALVVAFDVLGLPAVSTVLFQLLFWLPNLVVALVVLVIAGLAANALANFVRVSVAEAGLKNPAKLAKVTSGLVWTFGVIVAIYQLGIRQFGRDPVYSGNGWAGFGFGAGFWLGRARNRRSGGAQLVSLGSRNCVCVYAADGS
jgi:hypothetical protein